MDVTHTARDYQRAEQMLKHRRTVLVTGLVDRLVWSEESDVCRCAVTGPSGVEHVVVDPVAGTRESTVDDTEVAEPDAAGPGESRSPDGRWTVFLRDDDLWVRDEAGGEGPLTRDGSADNAYAVGPTFGQRRSFLRSSGTVVDPMVTWSPDGSRLLTHRMDERDVAVLHLVESTPDSGRRPVTHTQRYPMPGEPGQPTVHMVVVDLEQRTVTPSDGEPLHEGYLAPAAWSRAWWSADGRTAYHLDSGRFSRYLRLVAVDPATGRSRVVVEETGTTRVEPAQIIADPPVVHVLGNGEVLWYSQRDGWGHLYRYSASGAVLGQVTRGDWSVRSILHVDEDDGVVYFSASGLVDHDPYLRQLCRTDLDGTGFARLTDDVDDHVARISPSGRYLVDTASRVDEAPVVVVRDLSGEVRVEIARGDTTALERQGWEPPERFTVRAADGTTDLYGTLWRPHGFDPDRHYPVIDHVYPGPQSHRAPQCFDNDYTGEAEAFAALGFAVVAVDGRGTPGRSKEFHDASYGRLQDAGGLADHVATITELGRLHPWLDTDRVGITGTSGGGFAATRALLEYPGFFRAGIGQSGCHDVRRYASFWGEAYQGPWDPELYRPVANSELAGNLRGRLLLIHGELDDNVPPYQTLNLVDALIEANKDFELLLVPGVGHGMFHREAYVTRRRWDFFVRTLMGSSPPSGYRLADVPFGVN